MSHTVTVMRVPDERSEDIEFMFGGTHDGRCETWKECEKVWHRHPGEFYNGDYEWSTKRAGLHLYLDGAWCVAGDPDRYCALRYVFEIEPAETALGDIRVGETRHVDTEWDDGWILHVGGAE